MKGNTMQSLQKTFTEEIVKKLQKDLEITNPMAVPRIEKIVVNMGIKDAVADKKHIEKLKGPMAQITGQQAKVTRAKKAIAGFKLREGDAIGLVVTLRGKRMYAFIERLIKIVLPRIKDFRGVKRTSFDGQGNYSLGLYEYSVFPEIDPGSVDRLQGMEIIFVTSAKDKKEGFALLESIGIPFAKEAVRS